jgi:hypothetical protein
LEDDPSRQKVAWTTHASRAWEIGMQNVRVMLVVAGLATTMVAQLLASALCFRLSPIKGIASLVVPGYLFVGIKQTAYHWRVVSLWACGILAIIAGTIALS